MMLVASTKSSNPVFKGVLNTIIHRPQDGAEITPALIAHPAVRKINFTGSTAVGSIVAGLAGKALKPVLMELGGKVCRGSSGHQLASLIEDNRLQRLFAKTPIFKTPPFNVLSEHSSSPVRSAWPPKE
jgi:hypothetical protein